MDRNKIDRPQRASVRLKPPSIHDLARDGDVAGLRSLLLDNPELINARNSIMEQTPLHLAAAADKMEAVSFLLDWSGTEKADLEAKTRFGETPLHLAAKHGCTSALKLLLKRKSSIESIASNGMSPLHLAVWSAVRMDSCDAVEVLLDHNADVNAKDNDGMTPLDYVPELVGHEKLRTLLKGRLDLQSRQKAQNAFGPRMAELEADLNKVVGLKELKHQLRKWAKGMILDEQRRSLGLKVPKRRLPHMAFLGNPGTGKTMVARLLAKLFYKTGLLSCEKLVEVQRTDLVARYVGETGLRTRTKIQAAAGGILFIDEAYRLVKPNKTDSVDFGIEALEEIMSVMDDGDLVCIFAGYEEPMLRVLSANEGFRRRVSKVFHFEDFTPLEIAQMIQLKIEEQDEDSPFCGLKLDSLCTVEAIAELLESKTSGEQRSLVNGGLAWRIVIGAKENLDDRLDFGCCDCEALATILLSDIEVALDMISKEL